MSTLVIDKVSKRFEGVEVLKGIDLSLAHGEFLVLLGPSGCGKSTLLNIIAGLLEPTSGDVRIGDRSVVGVHPKDRNIAMVFQSYALYPNMSVRRNIGFGLEMRGVPATEREAVDRAAEILQIGRSSTAGQPSFRAVNVSASLSAGRWCAIRQCSSSTSRCPISTPSCAWKCAANCAACTRCLAPPWSMSPMTRSRR